MIIIIEECIEIADKMNCIFCEYLENKQMIAENELAFAIFDKFPVNEGHVLIIPKRHFSDFFEAGTEEIVSIYSLIHDMKKIVDKRLNPDGYNIGINVGEAAGQTIFHLHVHLIPRYDGDIENPRGGVRNLKKAIVHYDG